MRRLSVVFLDGESEDGAHVIESGVGVWEEKGGGRDGECEYKHKQKWREAKR